MDKKYSENNYLQPTIFAPTLFFTFLRMENVKLPNFYLLFSLVLFLPNYTSQVCDNSKQSWKEKPMNDW